MKIKFLFFAFYLIFFGTANISAHEYWFEPESFFLQPKEKTAIHLYVGDGLTKDREERQFQAAKTVMFQLFSASATTDLKAAAKDGDLPVYYFAPERAGNYLLAMERNWSFIKIEAAKFEDYLREDAMEYIIAERDKRNERNKEGRERYSRFLKSLLQVGERQDDVYKKTLGLKLEIVLLENPYAKKVGDRLRFRVLFDGKPLAGHAVFASNRQSEKQKVITDKSGEAAMTINQKGLWLIHLVTMRRCAAVDCGEADWESFWGALSFGAK
jgi:uncharacterized GH25 family protein